ncbi:helix-turn-helix transcriptional regulator [Halocatena marina]|uniref:helix-turn-helix transcriptional regulator n=1 Tax=Halocatena marina TaxID=2934937 RepID=UPI00200DEEB5|nr:hypothetical protein [Halocatena marina]
MRTGVILALLIAVCVLFTVHGSTAPVDATSSSVVNGSETVIEIQLQSDGDANISVETVIPLRDANDTAGFNQTKEDFRAGGFEGETIDVFRQAAAASDDETNRSMVIDNESVSRTAYIEEDAGKYVLEFTWLNFANRTVTEEGIILKTNDSFRTAQGTWLSVLGSNQSLAIRGPEGYQLIDSQQKIENRYIVWSGPRSFTQGDFAITYADYRIPQSTPSPNGPFEFDILSNPVIGLSMIIALVAIISVGVFAFSRRDGLLRRVTTDGGVGMRSTNAYEPSPTPDSDIDQSDSTEADTDTDVASTDTDTDDDSASGENGIDVELLSDEERVERLLEERGGRMKQANIVRETDWSNAKVSQLLSAMDEDGRIEKLRIGRENLISLSNHGENDQNSS